MTVPAGGASPVSHEAGRRVRVSSVMMRPPLGAVFFCSCALRAASATDVLSCDCARSAGDKGTAAEKATSEPRQSVPIRRGEWSFIRRSQTRLKLQNTPASRSVQSPKSPRQSMKQGHRGWTARLGHYGYTVLKTPFWDNSPCRKSDTPSSMRKFVNLYLVFTLPFLAFLELTPKKSWKPPKPSRILPPGQHRTAKSIASGTERTLGYLRAREQRGRSTTFQG